MQLKIDNMTFSYGEKETIKDISLHVNEGEFVGLIGPNGSGKSTLLKNICRALTPDAGMAVLDGENIFSMNHKRLALKMGAVGQENEVPFDFTVEEIVAMGRTPHKKLFEIDNEYDKYMTNHALEHVGMAHMAKRSYRSLSGGEKQRVVIARVIAQESEFLILDEPTNHLDISYQMQVFDFVKRLQITVLSAIHDLNMAALYCDRIYVLKAGKIVLHGTPEEVLTPENILDIYGVHCDTIVHPITGKVSITFLPEGIYAQTKR